MERTLYLVVLGSPASFFASLSCRFLLFCLQNRFVLGRIKLLFVSFYHKSWVPSGPFISLVLGMRYFDNTLKGKEKSLCMVNLQLSVFLEGGRESG